jgi:uncharacterized membrane protein
MNASYNLALAVGIGIVAGLRTMTAPAVVSWGAHFGRLKLRGTALGVLGGAWAAGILTVLAFAEYVVDLLPQTPNRTAAEPLAARILSGGVCGACLCASGGHSMWAGAVLGGVGGVIGAFGGYQARKRLVSGLRVPDAMIAIPEDVVAAALAWAIVFLG